MVQPEAVIGTGMNVLLWCAAVVTLIIGCVDMGWGKNEAKDLGMVLLAAGLLETIALAFMISKGGIFDATVAAAFILVLWYLGMGMVMGGTNRIAMTHGNMLTSLLFLGFAIWAGAVLGKTVLTIALALLVPGLWGGGAAAYLQKPVYGKIGGLCFFVDGAIFALMAFCGAVGIALP